jgi:hypothetical protein
MELGSLFQHGVFVTFLSLITTFRPEISPLSPALLSRNYYQHQPKDGMSASGLSRVLLQRHSASLNALDATLEITLLFGSGSALSDEVEGKDYKTCHK